MATDACTCLKLLVISSGIRTSFLTEICCYGSRCRQRTKICYNWDLTLIFSTLAHFDTHVVQLSITQRHTASIWLGLSEMETVTANTLTFILSTRRTLSLLFTPRKNVSMTLPLWNVKECWHFLAYACWWGISKALFVFLPPVTCRWEE